MYVHTDTDTAIGLDSRQWLHKQRTVEKKQKKEDPLSRQNERKNKHQNNWASIKE